MKSMTKKERLKKGKLDDIGVIYHVGSIDQKERLKKGNIDDNRVILTTAEYFIM